MRSQMKHKTWSQALKGKEYDPDAFDAAVEWLDDALDFIKDVTTIPVSKLSRRAKALIERAEEQK